MNPSKTKSQELFAEIGLKLKSAREAKGIGLGELSANIRINQSYLQGIEAGELDRLPAMTFLRGFLRNYAVAVGLDEGEITAQFKHVVDAANEGPVPLEPPAELSPQHLVSFSPTKALLIAAMVAMIGWAIYLIVQVATAPDSEETTTEESTPVPEESTEAAQSNPTPPAPAAPSAAAGQVAPTGQAAKPAEPPRNLQLTLKGLERSWVRLSVDRREPVDVLIEPAETGEWEANEEFRLTIGKSHAVSVYLNGEEIILPREHNMLIPELVLNKLTLLKLEN